MSSSVDLSVAGKSFQLKDKIQPRMTTRKTFNAAYFFDDNYKHEIANHYRDYKHQWPSRSRRRKQRDIFVRYRRQAFYGVISSCYSNVYRDVLPMAIHNFPRFAVVHTPRGRRTLCETKPPDKAYNDTLRRIGKATSCKEFKVLVERQVAWNKNKNIRGRNKALLTKQKCDINVVGKGSSNDLLKQQQQQKERQHQSQVYRQQRRSSTENFFYVDVDNYDDTDSYSYNNETVWKPHTEYSNNNKLTTYYLQLAAEYYEQGFLNNIKYLKSIGERNARIKREQKENNRKSRNQKNVDNSDDDDDTTTTTITTSTVTNVNPTIGIGGTATTKCTTARSGSSSNNSRIASTVSNASISTETSPGRTTATLADNYLWLRLRQILLKQQQRGSCNDKDSDRNWTTIRVNIIPAPPATSNSSSYKSASETATSKESNTETACCSMNDYRSLNAKFDTIQNLNANNKSSNNFHELIDHLMQLDIDSDLETATAFLPKITLTDCSTNTANERATTATLATVSQRTTEAETNAETETESNIAAASYYNNFDLREKQQQQQRKRNSFTLKQTKFGFNSSLDIPIDEADYHSEARPP